MSDYEMREITVDALKAEYERLVRLNELKEKEIQRLKSLILRATPFMRVMAQWSWIEDTK